MTELERMMCLILSLGDALLKKQDILSWPSDKKLEFVAQYLLANGVILPPCKIGDTVYYIHEELTMDGVKTVISTRKITGYGGNGLNPVWMVSAVPYELRFHPSEFGRTVFLTREEAEAELERRRKEGNTT